MRDFLGKVPKLTEESIKVRNQTYIRNQTHEFSKQLALSSEEVLEQKRQNYTEFLENLWSLLKSVDALEINMDPSFPTFGLNEWTAFWDIQAKIRELSVIVEDTKAQGYQSATNLSILKLKEKKNEFKNYCEFMVHNVFDHMLNGQNQQNSFSDGGFLIVWNMRVYNSEKNIKTEIKEVLTFDINNKKEYYLGAIKLLPEKEQQIISNLFDKANKERWTSQSEHLFDAEIKKEEYGAVLEHLTQAIERGQVLRGLISLAYYPHNKTLLNFTRRGLPLKNNSVLNKLWEEVTQKIAEINQKFRDHPEGFDSYKIYQQTFEPNKPVKELRFQLAEMRLSMSKIIQQLMGEPLMEKIAKEMWQKHLSESN